MRRSRSQQNNDALDNSDIWNPRPPAYAHEDETTVTGGESVPLVEEDEIDMVTNVEDLPETDLKDTVEKLRRYIFLQEEKKNQQKTIMQELGSQQTLEYIKGLEAETQRYKTLSRDQSHKLKNLRIANEALVRRKGGGAAKPPRRPQSAAVTGRR
jgi:hypothetical protein